MRFSRIVVCAASTDNLNVEDTESYRECVREDITSPDASTRAASWFTFNIGASVLGPLGIDKFPVDDRACAFSSARFISIKDMNVSTEQLNGEALASLENCVLMILLS